MTKKGSEKKTIEWKPNRAVFFSRKENETWHSYEGDGLNNRVALVYNLMTKRIREVYKAENKIIYLEILDLKSILTFLNFLIKIFEFLSLNEKKNYLVFFLNFLFY